MLKGFFSTKGLKNEWGCMCTRKRESEGEHHLHQGRYRCSLPAAQHVKKKKRKKTEDRTEAE